MGRFRIIADVPSLKQKILQVQNYPTLNDYFSATDFDRAVEEAEDSGVLPRFHKAVNEMPMLEAVVAVYFAISKIRSSTLGIRYATRSDPARAHLISRRECTGKGPIAVTPCLRVRMTFGIGSASRSSTFMGGSIPRRRLLSVPGRSNSGRNASAGSLPGSVFSTPPLNFQAGPGISEGAMATERCRAS